MLKPGSYDLVAFYDRAGASPYMEWLESLDWKTQDRIATRVARLKWGQFGDFKSLDGGLSELRAFFWTGLSSLFWGAQGQDDFAFVWRR